MSLLPAARLHIRSGLVLEVAGQSLESLVVSHSLDNGAHEDLDGAGVMSPLAIRGKQVVLELVFGCCGRDVDFVTKNHDGNVLQLLLLQEVGELCARLVESSSVRGVYEVNDAINTLGEIIFPDASCGLMASEIESFEVDTTHD